MRQFGVMFQTNAHSFPPDGAQFFYRFAVAALPPKENHVHRGPLRINVRKMRQHFVRERGKHLVQSVIQSGDTVPGMRNFDGLGKSPMAIK